MPTNVALIDPRKAAARALAGYLSTLTVDSGKMAGPYALKGLEDWPELDKSLTYPSASVVPVAGEYETTDLGIVYLYNDPIYKTAGWPTAFGLPVLPAANKGYLLAKCGEYRFPLQVDLWGDTIPQLDAIQRAVEDAMNGGIATGYAYYGLRLSAGTGYFNRTVEYGMRRDVSNTTADQALRDERRRTLIVDCSLEWVRAAALANLQPTVRLNVTEQALPYPPPPGSSQVPTPPPPTTK